MYGEVRRPRPFDVLGEAFVKGKVLVRVARLQHLHARDVDVPPSPRFSRIALEALPKQPVTEIEPLVAAVRCQSALEQVAQGATIIDIGGQSGITGVPEVPVDEEVARGATVVLTTHNLDEARHCDQVVLLAGTVIAAGDPDAVLTPDRLRSAARMGSDPIWKVQDPQLPKSPWWLSDAPFVGLRLVREP